MYIHISKRFAVFDFTTGPGGGEGVWSEVCPLLERNEEGLAGYFKPHGWKKNEGGERNFLKGGRILVRIKIEISVNEMPDRQRGGGDKKFTPDKLV